MAGSATDLLLDRSAREIAEALARRDLPALELTEAAIERIESRDRAINAVVVRDFERARETARAADAALARGEHKPLLGVPITVKEACNVAGLPTTWGATELAKLPPARGDTSVVSLLKAAGAVILGKTNVAPWLADWQSDNPVYGRTSNPWDLSRSPGGSSGGSAAAVAARMVPLELGSDMAGSLRIPAAFCGVYAHKPSYGVVPHDGFALPGVDGAPVPLAVLGPIARHPEDLELAMDVIAGPGVADAPAWHLALPPARHARLGDCRVLVLDRHPCAAADEDVRIALKSIAERLSQAGARVESDTEALPDLVQTFDVFAGILELIGARGAPAGPDEPPARRWFDLMDAQEFLKRAWTKLFATFDVVLAPAYGCAAFPHFQERRLGARVLMIDGVGTPYLAQPAWSSMASVANLPATVAPVALTRDGLPIGMQIIGPYLEDRTTISFARMLAVAGLAAREPSGKFTL